MSRANGMTEVEMLVELQAIYRLKARRNHAVDQEDWATYAELHTDDYVAMSISSERIVSGKAAAEALSVQLANFTTVHQGAYARDRLSGLGQRDWCVGHGGQPVLDAKR